MVGFLHIQEVPFLLFAPFKKRLISSEFHGNEINVLIAVKCWKRVNKITLEPEKPGLPDSPFSPFFSPKETILYNI